VRLRRILGLRGRDSQMAQNYRKPGDIGVEVLLRYWKLLHAAGSATGLPVLYNTSFNLFGEPLVCTPRDAVRSFYSSGIDAMFVDHFFLQK
jgi:predicted NodU family carbamoyl transferase